MKAKETGFAVEISVKTLYNNIDNGDIDVTRMDLLRKYNRKQNNDAPRKALNNLKGESTENRPIEANNRAKYRHWEMDLVVSCKGSKQALLTLTERKFREKIIVKLPDKMQNSVKLTLDKLEQKYGK